MSDDQILFADQTTDADVERADATLNGLGAVGVTHVSASQINQYRRCPRQWAYRQVLGLKVPPDGGLIVGLGVHRAAEVGMLHKMDTGSDPEPEQAAEAAAEYVTDRCATGEVQLDDDTPGVLADRAVRSATAWAEQAAPLVTPTDVEAEFDTVLAGIPVKGRMDVVTADTVVDWKTSGKSPSRGDLLQATQTSIYGAVTGRRVSYIYMVNLTKQVKVTEVALSPEETAKAASLAASSVADIAQGMAMGVWPRNPQGWHCSQRWCGYYDRCMAGRDDATFTDKAADARGAAGVMW